MFGFIKNYRTKRSLRNEIFNLKQEVEYFKAEWKADFDRYQLYKNKVIELNTRIEQMNRDQDR